ncbi:rRNA promoter binding protein [Galdieria sulphuraria]|uniref:rRNA promoter binding protein n=1 Tax=Galdieria sulphuraria TaxID=130081 RepID=M2Y301_GALSU|nr:rRNA promoter binding protein [Galdieria sulphuraria]|eukprot:XP_005706714.1 rRNA promoter binding protein [Galdieria sulphuraria]
MCKFQTFHASISTQTTVSVKINAVHIRSFTHTFHATLRANPCPKVTDPICRIPLSSIFYQLEATHLGVLMRFIGTDRWEFKVYRSFKELHKLPFFND